MRHRRPIERPSLQTLLDEQLVRLSELVAAAGEISGQRHLEQLEEEADTIRRAIRAAFRGGEA